VKSGGPRAALERAVQYLDAWHAGQHLTKVQTAIRCDFCVQQSQGQPEWDEELLVG
jgi:methylase of polypeptide subunit release factors